MPSKAHAASHPSRYVGAALAVVCALGAVGCMTLRGTISPDSPPSATERAEKKLGFVGMTFDLAFPGARAAPRVELEVADEQGARTKLLASPEAGKEGPQPLLFALEQGKYEIRRAVLRIAGGDYGGSRYTALNIELELRNGVGSLSVAEGEFVHLGAQSIKVTLEAEGQGYTAFHSQNFVSALPSRTLWSPVLSRVEPAKRSYLRRAEPGAALETRAWSDEPPPTGAGVDPTAGNGDKETKSGSAGRAGRSSSDRKDQLEKLLTRIGFEVGRCARAHVPAFKGGVRFDVLVGPEGAFDGVTFKTAEWESSKAASGCVTSYLAKQRLSERDDGRSDSWELQFEVK